MLGEVIVEISFFTHINCRREKLIFHKFDVETKARAKETLVCRIAVRPLIMLIMFSKACAVVKCHGS